MISILQALSQVGQTVTTNLALNLAHFSRWTLRDKAAQRRLALRQASQNAPSQQVCRVAV